MILCSFALFNDRRALITRQELVFLEARISTGQLDCHPGGFFLYSLPTPSVIYAKLCTSSWKNAYRRDIAARAILNDILTMSPSALVRLTVICVREYFFVSPKATLRVYRAVGKYFPM